MKAAVRRLALAGCAAPALAVTGHSAQAQPAAKVLLDMTYVRQIHHALLRNGVRPIVELGLMPIALTARPDRHPFWHRSAFLGAGCGPAVSAPMGQRR